MTLSIDRPDGSVGTARQIDLRCTATTPSIAIAHRGHDAGRCQLLAGHDGDHALMYAGPVERAVLTWSAGASATRGPDEWHRLPWTHGFPFPAWFAE